MELVSTLFIKKETDLVLDENTVYHHYDTFSGKSLRDLFNKVGTPRAIVNDHLTLCDENLNTNFIGLPLFFYKMAKDVSSADSLESTALTTDCFNFMCNKKRINRFLLKKFLHIFDLTTDLYTWSGYIKQFDLTTVIKELDCISPSQPVCALKSTILKELPDTPRRVIDAENIVDCGSYFLYGPNDSDLLPIGPNWLTWSRGIDQIFKNSAVSLITEPAEYEKVAIFTEKTVFAILGLTFPIWVGGYKQADELARMGFDVFNDVIDHSYQYYDTLVERCYWAIANNLDLLRDLDKTSRLRLKHLHRLQQNRQKLTDKTIYKFIVSNIQSHPVDIQPFLYKCLSFFE